LPFIIDLQNVGAATSRIAECNSSFMAAPCNVGLVRRGICCQNVCPSVCHNRDPSTPKRFKQWCRPSGKFGTGKRSEVTSSPLPSSPLPSPPLFFASFPTLPSPFPLPCPSLPSLPLEVDPRNPAMGSGTAVSSLTGV